jgi:hypothetical protein
MFYPGSQPPYYMPWRSTGPPMTPPDVNIPKSPKRKPTNIGNSIYVLQRTLKLKFRLHLVKFDSYADIVQIWVNSPFNPNLG